MRFSIFKPVFAILISASAASAQTRAEPFAIADNSFLVEEAFNQEKGIFQNIVLFQRARGGEWQFEFTQEWPVGGATHQLSYTIPYAEAGLGRVMLNWRVQAAFESGSTPAVSPRLSVILPTGANDAAYEAGVQFNLPVSRQFGDIYVHANAGATYDRVTVVRQHGLVTPHAGLGLIYRVLPMVHVMAESVIRSEPTLFLVGGDACCERQRETSVLFSPGVRAGVNLGDHQLVLGAAVPLSLRGSGESALLLYTSYELPFTRSR